MLEIKDLSVRIKGKEILRGINLKIREGETHALLGPNASGKSTLAFAIMGLPGYEVAGGEIRFEGKDIVSLPIEKRSKLGIALAFQHPPVVRGVTLSRLLNKVSRRPVRVEDFLLDSGLSEREVNLGFSGGERKLSEILQVVSLDPHLVILDELDSGLDPENLERLASLIEEKLLKNGVSLLLISHHGEILKLLRPNFVHVMLKGRIINTSRDWKRVFHGFIQTN